MGLITFIRNKEQSQPKIGYAMCLMTICLLLIGCNDSAIKDAVQEIIVIEESTPVLRNDIIEVHLSQSGSINHISTLIGENLINDRDLGRHVQVSFYAGEDQTHPDQHPAWSPWPWNIIQAGDVYGTPAGMWVIGQSFTDAEIVSIPMFWDRRSVRELGAIIFSNIDLIKNVIRVHVRLKLSDNCSIVNPRPMHQEMPAVYTIGELHHLISGDNEIQNPGNDWVYWDDAEWAGAFGDDGFGLAVYLQGTELFIGGRYENGSDKTTYFSPLRTMTIKPGDEIKYTYYIVVGTVQDVNEAVLRINRGY